MSSAPITIPLLGQSTRSLSSVVSAVIVFPALDWLASAGPALAAAVAITIAVTTVAFLIVPRIM